MDIKLSPEALADKLTMSGLEVKGIETHSDDYVFEIEITSNRPDWLSVLGIAREVAAITNRKLRLPKVACPRPIAHDKKKKTKSCGAAVFNNGTLRISIESLGDCPLYTAKVLTGVTVGPSPEWLRRRLELVGCRSINNVVDVTNYVMFVWGEPLHAFDLDKVGSDTIVIRRARSGEIITTIDGQDKPLDNTILVIADNKKPLAVAGVMGGKESEVGASTKNVLLEAAVFDQVLIRHGRQKLGLQTESSYRFERGIDSPRALTASIHAAALMQQLAGGTLTVVTSAGKKPSAQKAFEVSLSSTQTMLGVEVGAARIKTILQPLGFSVVTRSKDILKVTAPSFRQDVKTEVDVLEEVARVYGYDKTPVTLPAIKPRLLDNQARAWITVVREAMIGLGAQEALTHSLIDRDVLVAAGFPGLASVSVANPLSKEQEIMRPTLVPSLLQCVARNLNQQQEYVSLFEIASVYIPVAGGVPEERPTLGIALSGTREVLLPQGVIKDEAGLLHIKGMCQSLAARLGVEGLSLAAGKDPDEAGIVVDGDVVGFARAVSKKSLDAVDIKNKTVCVAEINCASLLGKAHRIRRFRQLPKFPSVSRDVCFVVKDSLSAGEVIAAVQSQAPDILRNVRVSNYYKGKQIADGYKALTVSCVYRADDRTLTEMEVNPAHELMCDAVKKTLGATVR